LHVKVQVCTPEALQFVVCEVVPGAHTRVPGVWLRQEGKLGPVQTICWQMVPSGCVTGTVVQPVHVPVPSALTVSSDAAVAGKIGWVKPKAMIKKVTSGRCIWSRCLLVP
jgi:hypothetical protein